MEQVSQATARNRDNVSSDGEQPILEITHESQDELDNSDNDRAGETKSGSRVMSKY